MRARLLIEWLVVSLLAIAAVAVLIGYRLGARADNLLYDAVLSVAHQPGSDGIIIVAIDEDSLATLGRWPWPRRIHTEMLDRLAQAKPAVVGYDVLFVEPGDDDARLAAAMRALGRVAVPLTFETPGTNGAPYNLEAPVAPIAAAARAVGHAVLVPDEDGIVRSVSLLAGNGGERWPHFAEQIDRVATGAPSRAFGRMAPAIYPASQLSFSAPALIPFTGARGNYRTVSFVHVLRGEVPPEYFRDRIVLVGSTASGAADRYSVPGGSMAGVEVLANIVDGLRSDREITRASRIATMAFALVPLAALLASLLLFAPRVNILLGLGLLVATLAISVSAMLLFRVWIAPTGGLAGLLIAYPLWAWRRLEAVSTYMAQELRRLSQEPDPLPGGEAAAPVRPLLAETLDNQTSLLNRAITRVRDLRQFFADNLQELPDPTLVLDHKGEVLLANRAAEQLFGDHLRLCTGKPSVDRLLAAIISPVTKPMTPLPGVEQEILTADERVFNARLVPLLDTHGRSPGAIFRLTDITPIRIATRQREDTLQLLTHDMRSPQASILALLERAQDEPGARDKIAAYARRTLELADNFVQLARAETGRVTEEVVDVQALLTEAIDDQWVLASQKHITISGDDDDREYLVIGDSSLLRRAMINLLGNAIKYSEPGTTIACRVDLIDEGAQSIVRCSISDEGRGIAPDEQRRLFERFHRLRTDGRKDPGGTGLGLAFVQTAMIRMGGRVECLSAPGEGSTFLILLPAAPPEMASVE